MFFAKKDTRMLFFLLRWWILMIRYGMSRFFSLILRRCGIVCPLIIESTNEIGIDEDCRCGCVR